MTYEELDKIKNEINSNMSPIYGISVNAYPAYHYMTYESEFFTITMGLYNGHIDIQFNNFNVVTRNEHLYKFVKACIELVETPIEERKPEKKYYLKHKYIFSNGFLSYYPRNNIFSLESREEAVDWITQFTEKEIEEIEAKGFDLRNFARIEAEE